MNDKTQLRVVNKNAAVVTPGARLSRAKELDRLAKGSIMQLIYALKEIMDNELFDELGFDSMRDYVQKSLKYSYTNTRYYLNIVQKLGEYLPVNDYSRRVVNPGDSGESLSKNDEFFTEMPFHKLYNLSRLPEKNIKDLFLTGVTTINDKPLTLETVKLAQRDDLGKIITREINKIEETAVQKKVKQTKTLLDLKLKIRKQHDSLMKSLLLYPFDADQTKQLFSLARPFTDFLTKHIENS
jgi:hypothetical protein